MKNGEPDKLYSYKILENTAMIALQAGAMQQPTILDDLDATTQAQTLLALAERFEAERGKEVEETQEYIGLVDAFCEKHLSINDTALYWLNRASEMLQQQGYTEASKALDAAFSL